MQRDELDVWQPGGIDYTNAFTYAASGAVTAMTLGNNLVDHTSYNSRLQPTQIGLGTSATDSSVFKLDYGFGTSNNNGNVLSQTITVGAGGPTPVVLNQSYTYDALNRLQTAGETNNGATNWSRTFNYDRYGNMWVTAPIGILPGQMTPQLQSDIDANTNRLSASGYDVSGNQVTDQTSGTSGNSYGYDAENHMTSCTVSGQSSSYGYDATGNRVWKTVGTTSTVFVYNVSGQLVAEYGGPPPATTGTSYLTTDHLGSTRVITASDQSIRSRSDYLPFGEEIGAFGAGRSGAGGVAGYSSSTDIHQKFTSKERDTESNLDYFGARYYSSTQGRFTSSDPLLSSGTVYDPQSWNRYSYTLNSPLKYVDPDGLWVWDASAGGSKDDKDLSKDELKRRNAFRQALKDDEKARNKFKPGSEEYKRIDASIKAYGQEGIDNGVMVGFAKIKTGGETTPQFQSDSAGLVTAKVQVTLNSSTVGDAGEMARTVAHEGQHAADAQAFAALDWVHTDVINSPLNLNGYQKEARAYAVTSFVLQAQDAENVRYGGEQLWSSGWREADRATRRSAAIDKYLEHSSTYPHSRPSDHGRRYVEP